jgi:hypothetical protein
MEGIMKIEKNLVLLAGVRAIIKIGTYENKINVPNIAQGAIRSSEDGYVENGLNLLREVKWYILRGQYRPFMSYFLN